MHKEISVNINKDIFFYIPTIFLFFSLPFFDIPKINFGNDIFLYLLLGVIESVTMIIPGISGTAILIALDLYDDYLNFIISLVDINFFISNIKLIFIYSLSLIIGGYLTIKVVINLYNKFIFFSSVIRCLMVITIFIMLKDVMFDANFDFIYLAIFPIGFILSVLFNKIFNRSI